MRETMWTLQRITSLEYDKILIARRILFPAPIPENYHREADPISGPGVYMMTFPLRQISGSGRVCKSTACLVLQNDAGSLFDYIQKYYYNHIRY